MYAVFINAGAVAVGACIGLIFNKYIPERLTDALMKGLALCTLYIGFSGALKGENTLILIISVAVGTLVGTLIDIDRHFNRLVRLVEERFHRTGKRSLAEGFITSSLLFCVGAMTVVGSLTAGLTGDGSMLLTKSALDFVSAIVFAASLGAGVLFSALFVLILQGGIVLLSSLLAPLLTAGTVAEMTCVGSVLIIALGLNMLGLTKLKVLNCLPAVFLPLLLCLFM